MPGPPLVVLGRAVVGPSVPPSSSGMASVPLLTTGEHCVQAASTEVGSDDNEEVRSPFSLRVARWMSGFLQLDARVLVLHLIQQPIVVRIQGQSGRYRARNFETTESL